MPRTRVGTQTSATGATPAADMGSTKSPKKKGFKLMRVGVAAMFVSVAILVAALVVFVIFGGSRESDLIKTNKYQAVFLSDQNGQVYFGKLSLVNNRYYKLTDIYYVRVEQQIQPDNKQTTTTSTANQNVSLAKLGNELHGPEDTMYISRDKVLFWENLKDDGQVVTAIQAYKKNGGKATATPTPTATTPVLATPTPSR